MKSHLQIHRFEDRTVDWYKVRNQYIGSSEVGTIMGHDPWNHSVRVYYRKLGLDTDIPDNNKMRVGRDLEDLIAKYWMYADGNEDEHSWVENMNADNLQRKCKNIHGIIINPNYPWLCCNLDRVINKGQHKIFSPSEILQEECPLEIKWINDRYMKMWEAGIPPAYLAQVTQQMIVTETEYSELALLDSNSKLHVYNVEMSNAFKDAILEQTYDFWYQRVVPARKALEEIGDITFDEKIPEAIQHLEPDPNESDAYKEFFAERLKVEDTVLEATDEDADNAYNMKLWQAVEKTAKGKSNLYRNKLIQRCKGELASQIDLGSDGKVNYKPRGENPKPILMNYARHKFDKDQIEELFSKSNFHRL